MLISLVSLFKHVIYVCLFLDPETKREMMGSGETMTGTMTGATCTGRSRAGGVGAARAAPRAGE